jgi:hypothetical protein
MNYNEEIIKLEQENNETKAQAKVYIDDFVDEIRNVDKKQLITISTPKKFKIPFKVKLKRFFDKLNKTLG